MRLGILSDTHNQIQRLNKALDWLKTQQVSTLIHCGDLTETDLVQAFYGFDVYYVFGNGDVASGEIASLLSKLNPSNQAANSLDLEIGGKRFFVAHGHQPRSLEKALQSQAFDYVIQGHTHRFNDQKQGRTRLLNPGALGGMKREERSFGLLDLETEEFRKLIFDELEIS